MQELAKANSIKDQAENLILLRYRRRQYPRNDKYRKREQRENPQQYVPCGFDAPPLAFAGSQQLVTRHTNALPFRDLNGKALTAHEYLLVNAGYPPLSGFHDPLPLRLAERYGRNCCDAFVC